MIDSATGSALGLTEQLALFRETHPVYQVESCGLEWDFLSSGSGDQAIVLLPGLSGGAEDMFPLISALEDEFRVIAIGVPQGLAHVPDLVQAISQIMTDRGVSDACLLGHSFGGMLAECFMLQYPERTNGLILANMAHFGTFREIIVRGGLGIAPYLPREWVDRQLGSAFHHLLKGCPDQDFWTSFLASEITSLGKSAFENRLDFILDTLPRYPTKRLDMDAWRRRVLILESDREVAFTLPERDALRELYPQAQTHILPAASHFSPYCQLDEFVAVTKSFLAQY